MSNYMVQNNKKCPLIELSLFINHQDHPQRHYLIVIMVDEV